MAMSNALFTAMPATELDHEFHSKCRLQLISDKLMHQLNLQVGSTATVSSHLLLAAAHQHVAAGPAADQVVKAPAQMKITIRFTG